MIAERICFKTARRWWVNRKESTIGIRGFREKVVVFVLVRIDDDNLDVGSNYLLSIEIMFSIW